MILRALSLLALQTPASEPMAIDLGPVVQHLAVASLEDGEVASLLAIQGRTISLIELVEGPSYEMPGQATLWTLADLDLDGTDEFYLLVEGRDLHRLIWKDDAFALSTPLISNLGAMPPRGCHPGQFLYDIDGDRRADLCLPVGDRLSLRMGTADGFVEGPELGTLSSLELRTGGGLMGKLSRRLSVPRLIPEDVSGDGRPDLVINDGEIVRQYIVGEEGFPTLPTRTLDLSRFRADMEDLRLDLGNLTKSVKYLIQDKWADLDGDGDLDVMILADGMVRTFLGDENGIDLSKQKAPVKVRGNVFYIYPARIDPDPHPDLVLVRVEDLGIGKVLQAALFAWEIRFDFLVFRGRGDGRFETRVYRDRTAKLQGDSILSIYKEERDQLTTLRRKIVRMCDTDGDGVRSDLVTLDADGNLSIWRDLVSDASVLHGAIEQFLQQTLSGEGDLEMEISALTQWTLGRTSAMTSVADGVEPDQVLKLEGWAEPHAMTVRDLDGDGREDILALRIFQPEEGSKRLIGYRVSL